MKKLIYLLIFTLFVIGCDKEDNITQPQQEIVNKEVLNTNTTKIDTNDNTVNKVTENSVTVEKNSKTENLKVGGVIVQGATKDNPDGFARKITAIKKVNGKVVLETEQAKITDVYKEFSIRAPITVDYSKKPIVLNNNVSARGVYANTSNKGVGAKVKFELNENTKEYKYEVIFSKKVAGVKGEIKFEGGLKIENEKSEFIYNLRPGTDKVFFVQNGMKVTYTNKITTKGTFKKEAEFVEVARIPLTIPSPTDFVIYPALILKMGVSGKITGEVTVTSTNTLEYDCSLSYTENKGSGWDRIKKFIDSPFSKGNKTEQGQWRTFSYKKFDSKTDFEGKVKLELKAHFTPALRIVLTQYRDAKVGIYLDNYLKFQAETKPGKIDWDFGYGMDYKAITQFTLINDDFIKVDYQGKLWEKPYTKLTWGTYELPEKVYNGDVVLRTQQEVDDFGEQGYTKINGDLLIGGPENPTLQDLSSNPNNISSLQKLNTLFEIKGNLSIIHTSLTNLKGLDNLTKIEKGLYTGRSFYMMGNLLSLSNRYLKSLEGLNNLKKVNNLYITGSVNDASSLSNLEQVEYISFNGTEFSNLNFLRKIKKIERIFLRRTSLKNFNGLQNLESLNEIYISGGNGIINFIGLEKIKELKKFQMGEYHYCIGNESHKSFQGLENLKQITGSFILIGSKKLKSFQGLNNLKNIGGNITIICNSDLSDYCLISEILKENYPNQFVSNKYNPTKQDIINGNCKQ